MAPAAESNAFESDAPITGTIEGLESIADILCFNPGMLKLQLLRKSAAASITACSKCCRARLLAAAAAGCGSNHP